MIIRKRRLFTDDNSDNSGKALGALGGAAIMAAPLAIGYGANNYVEGVNKELKTVGDNISQLEAKPKLTKNDSILLEQYRNRQTALNNTVNNSTTYGAANKIGSIFGDAKNWLSKTWNGVSGLDGVQQTEYDRLKGNLDTAKNATIKTKRGGEGLSKSAYDKGVKNAQNEMNKFMEKNKVNLTPGSGKLKVLGLGAAVLGTGALIGSKVFGSDNKNRNNGGVSVGGNYTVNNYYGGTQPNNN